MALLSHNKLICNLISQKETTKMHILFKVYPYKDLHNKVIVVDKTKKSTKQQRI